MRDLAYIKQPEKLALILEETAKLGFTLGSEPGTGAMLRVLAASKRAGRFLELGTGTGIATSWLLDGLDAKSQFITVDNDSRVQSVARNLLADDHRLRIITEDASAFLRRQPPESFDLIFADAMPGKYELLEETLHLIRPGGLYVIDDMLPQSTWPEGHETRVAALLQTLSTRDDLVMVPLEWASGLVVAVKKRACLE